MAYSMALSPGFGGKPGGGGEVSTTITDAPFPAAARSARAAARRMTACSRTSAQRTSASRSADPVSSARSASAASGP